MPLQPLTPEDTQTCEDSRHRPMRGTDQEFEPKEPVRAVGAIVAGRDRYSVCAQCYGRIVRSEREHRFDYPTGCMAERRGTFCDRRMDRKEGDLENVKTKILPPACCSKERQHKPSPDHSDGIGFVYFVRGKLAYEEAIEELIKDGWAV